MTATLCISVIFWKLGLRRARLAAVSNHLQATPALLAATDLFVGLPEAALQQVAAKARVQSLPRHARIFHQGDDQARIHALFSGWVRISQSADDGDPRVAGFVAPGNIFGVMAPFSDGRYRTNATVAREAIEASWSEADLMRLMLQSPEIALNMVRIIGSRLVELQERARELATQRADRRVANALLRILAQSGQQARDGATIPFPLRRRDIADITGTTLYTASRILAGWEAAGLVEGRHQLLTIRDIERLTRIARAEDE